MNRFRQSIHPGLRGALFYSAYWGVVGLYEPYLNVFFLRSGLDETQIGWLSSVLPLCVMLVTPLVTRIADHTHRRVWFLAGGCLGYGLALTGLAYPGLKLTFPMLLGIVALYSIFRSPIISLADSLIAHMAGRHQLDFGAMRLWGSVIFTISAIAIGSVWEHTGYNTMFMVTAVGFLPVTITALLLEEVRGQKPGVDASEETGQVRTEGNGKGQAAVRSLPPVDRGLWFLLGGTFLIMAAMFMGMNFGTIYMAELGGTQMMIGAVLGVSAMLEVPGMLYGNRLARHMGATNTLLLGYGLIAVGLVGFGVAGSPWWMLVFTGIRGLGFGLVLVANVTIINRYAPQNYVSTFQGVFNAACYGLAPLLGGPISGSIYQTQGPATLFLLAGGLSIIAGLVLLPTYRIWKRE